MKKYLIITASFLLLLNVNYANSAMGKNEEVYQENGKYYVEINNVTYGPYEKLDSSGVLKSGNSWGFKYYKDFSDDKPPFATYEIHFMVNGTNHGPYNIRYDALDRYDLHISDNNFGFTFPHEDGSIYAMIGENEIGPCQSIRDVKITDGNYGFYCLAPSGERSYLYINGEKHYIESSYISNIKITLNHWGYIFSEDYRSYVRRYVVINGDSFGPYYEKIYDFTMNDDNWAFAYEKNGEYFILSNGNKPYKLPLTKEQAEDDIHGLFSELFYTGGQQCSHMSCYAYKNRLVLEDDFWYLKYNIGENELKFSNKPKKEIKISNDNLFSKVKGKIIIKVEDMGKAYYINPKSKIMHYLGRPNDAFNVMREQGVGISEDDYNLFGEYAPSRLAGHILLRVEANGEAYYVNPEDNKIHYLGRPADAFNIMRGLGLGISNNDFYNL